MVRCPSLLLGCACALASAVIACGPTIPPNACSTNNGGCDQHAFCSDQAGVAVCTCIPSYQGNGTVCKPRSPCDQNFGGCDPNATCVADGDFAVCACSAGYIGDGYHCETAPSCMTHNGGCDPHAMCFEGSPGVVTCACDTEQGYVGDGTTCQTCTPTACGDNATCAVDVTNNQLQCNCQDGYVGNPPSQACVPASNCVPNNGGCDTNANCTPTDGGAPICTCKPGFTGGGSALPDGGPGCTPVATCAPDGGTCDRNATCSNGPTGPLCTCNAGYSGDGMTCAAAFCEQRLDNCDQNAKCADTTGSFTCTCNSGYTGGGTVLPDGGAGCTETNVCNPNPCGLNQTCTQTGPGTHSCACSSGYQMAATGDGGMSCQPVNHCKDPNPPCSGQNEMCVYTGPGSTMCACNSGYSFQSDMDGGMACEPINHCNDPTSPCPANSMCNFTGPGTYSCTCDTGYETSGNQCVPINHCNDSPPACDPNAQCKYTGPGTYTCACDPGFTGNGTTCQAHYLQVAVGDTHICAIRADDPGKMDGSLYCWGWNESGQLGNGTPVTSAPVLSPQAVSNPTTNKWVSVAAGTSDTCGIQTDGTLWCWGSNVDGQIGAGAGMGWSKPQKVVATTQPWLSVATEGHHTCGVISPGDVWCWGDNTDGQLGQGTGAPTQTSSPTSAVVGSNGTYLTTRAGTGHSCALQGTSILCWGDNSHAQIAQCPTGGTCSPSVSSEVVPTLITPPTMPQPSGNPPGNVGWSSMFAGQNGTCGIQTDDSLWCWGLNDRGQVGIRSLVSPQAVPAAVGSAGNFGSWLSAALGTEHTCGIQTDGNVFCWGDNTSGQLGQGTYSSYSLSPLAVMLPSGSQLTFKSISANSVYTCAIDTSNDLWCWGQPTGAPPPAPQPIYTGTGMSCTAQTPCIPAFSTMPTLITK